MQTEIEAKWIVPDLAIIRKKLNSLNAVMAQTERLMKRRTFDYPNKSLQKIGGWIRVRDEGNKKH